MESIKTAQHIGTREEQQDRMAVIVMDSPHALETAVLKEWMKRVFGTLIGETSRHPDSMKVGSTATIALVLPDNWVLIGYMGDSPALRLREQGTHSPICDRLTDIHTVYRDTIFLQTYPNYDPLRNEGRIWSPEDQDGNGFGINMTRALGDAAIEMVVREPTLVWAQLQPKDILVVASDGLEQILSFPDGFRGDVAMPPLSEWGENPADYLTTKAYQNRQRGSDNISVLTLQSPVTQPVLVCMFDGHGGTTIADFAASRVVEIAQSLWVQHNPNLQKNLRPEP